MDSIGLLLNDNRLLMVLLRKGFRGDAFLHSYRLVSLRDVKPEDRDDIIVSNIEGFIDQTKSDRENLFLGIPGSKVIFKRITLPAPTEENLKEVLGYEMDRYTPFALEDVFFDYKIVARDEAHDSIHVLLMVVKKSVIDYYLTLLRRIHVKTRCVEVLTTALFNLAAQDAAAESGGAGTGTVVFRGAQWLRAQGWGKGLAAYLDRLMKKGGEEKAASEEETAFLLTVEDECCELGVVRNSAFAYARSFPVSRSADGGAAAELANQIISAMETTRLSLGYDQAAASRVVLAGSRADAELAACLSGQGAGDVRLLDTLRMNVLADDARERVPGLSPAVGLALKGLDGVALDVNFIPQELRPKKKKNWSLIAGVMLIGLVFLGISSYAISFFVKERFYLAELNERIGALKGRVAEVEKMKEEIAAIEQKMEVVEKIKAGERSKLELLRELTETIPDDMWLTRFAYTDQKGKREIDLSGFANAASELIPILEKSKYFEDVKFKSSIVKDRSTEKEKFNVTATVTREQEAAPPASAPAAEPRKPNNVKQQKRSPR
jgi:general secretion pathway protein L